MAGLSGSSSDFSDEGIIEELTLDCLPFDAIVLVCDYLPPSDLVHFSRVCKFFHEASHVGSLWRQHSLERWVFCDVHQVSEGPSRWQRYFSARRKVEARQEQGRPGRDYKVKTLRGHEADIQSVEVVGGGRVSWEDPRPPLLVSLAGDGSVKAWDVLQAQPVWSQEGRGLTSMAASEQLSEVAIAVADGSVELWDCRQWKETGRLVSGAGLVTRLQYGCTSCSELPKVFLMAVTAGNSSVSDHVALWNTHPPSTDEAQAATPTKPLLQLWAPSQSQRLLLSPQGLLALDAIFGEVHVWELPSLVGSREPPPHRPHLSLHTHHQVAGSCWVGPGCLATLSVGGASIELWDVGGHLASLKKARRLAYDDRNMYNPLKTIPCRAAPVAVAMRMFPGHAHHVAPTSSVMCCAHSLLLVGDQDGGLIIVDPSTGGEVQKFNDHKGAITDIHADRYRVLTCSKDFSIRVYRWLRGRGRQDRPSLESRYTLLGGSVAHKTHDGFHQLVCEAGSCVGVCGAQLKFYTFACKLDSN